MRHPSCVTHRATAWCLLLAAGLLLRAAQAVAATASASAAAEGAVPAGYGRADGWQAPQSQPLLQLPSAAPSAALVQSARRLKSSGGQPAADGSSRGQLASHEAGGLSSSILAPPHTALAGPAGPSRGRAAAGLVAGDAGGAGSSVGTSSSSSSSSNDDTPATADSSVNIRQTTQLVCNGRVMTLTVPLPPYTQFVPPFAPTYTNPPDFTCSRPNGGSCGVLQKASCGSTGISAGPANLSPDGDGTLPPDNPLLFTINPGSLKRFTFVNWTVFDVGAAGAMAVAFYADGSGQERVTHQWAPDGPQRNPGETGDTFCSDCSNCELGKGIKSMALQAAPGKGFSGFSLSQASARAACGPGCAGTDTIFWVGFSYVCVEPTCGDVSPDTPGLQPFDCGESGSMYTFNAAEADSNLVSVEGCCLAKTCATPDPAAPGLAFDCAAFNQDPTGTRPGMTCSSLPNPGSIFAPSVVTCCECVTVKQSGGDISITKLVSPGSPPKKTNKAGTSAPDGLAAAGNEPGDGQPPSAAAAIAPAGGTRSSVSALRSVGTVFSFTLVVKLQGLQDDVAEFVQLQDVMPPGLLIESVVESPFEGACDVSSDGSRVSCVWSRLTFMDDTRTVTVQARASRAGSLLNCASVSTASDDSDLTNNESCATVRVQAACCTRLANGTPTCEDRLPGNCNSPTAQVFHPESSCADSPCFVPPSTKGACCLALQARCVQPATPGACAAAGGAYTPGALCSQVRCERSATGACCLGPAKQQQGGSKCMDEQAADVCAAISGTFYEGASCWDIRDVCTPAGSGACCNVKTGGCRNNVPERLCPSEYNMWLQGGKCGNNGFCTGACCRSGRGAKCLQTLKSGCSGSNRWYLSAACSEVTCPVESGPGCLNEWKECDPARDDCCEGLRCQFTNSDRASTGAYACKRQSSQCVGPGTPCGGASGNTCCSGLLCRWDYANREGSCQPAGSCARPGAPCSSDDETCRGCRCLNGRSKAVTFQMCYGTRRCRSYSCFLNRRLNCDCLHASAASL